MRLVPLSAYYMCFVNVVELDESFSFIFLYLKYFKSCNFKNKHLQWDSQTSIVLCTWLLWYFVIDRFSFISNTTNLSCCFIRILNVIFIYLAKVHVSSPPVYCWSTICFGVSFLYSVNKQFLHKRRYRMKISTIQCLMSMINLTSNDTN